MHHTGHLQVLPYKVASRALDWQANRKIFWIRQALTTITHQSEKIKRSTRSMWTEEFGTLARMEFEFSENCKPMCR